MMTLPRLLDLMWHDYAHLNPHVHSVVDMLLARGEKIVNDHLALRTFNRPKVGLEILARPFVELGYQPREEYAFAEKHLRARYYAPPDSAQPKVFISELKVQDFSLQLQALVDQLVGEVPAEAPAHPEFLVAGRLWRVTFRQYEELRRESEYAAWVAAFGFRPNHFTILVNALKTLPSLPELNSFLKRHGFRLNSSGGEIKGSPEVYLEQSSTLADVVPVEFADGTHPVPACYYEFAKRYPLPDGHLYQGFVEKSADKIFESTDRK